MSNKVKPEIQSAEFSLDDSANGVYSPLQIQQAKDFIWKFMDAQNRQLVINMAIMSTHERHGLYVKQMFAELEADKKDGLIVKERMIIGQQYSRQPNPEMQTA